jgi:hypothetical protein
LRKLSDLDETILSEMLLTSTFLRLTGNVFAWEAALHKYMDRDMARKGMLLTKDEGLKMADIIFRSSHNEQGIRPKFKNLWTSGQYALPERMESSHYHVREVLCRCCSTVDSLTKELLVLHSERGCKPDACVEAVGKIHKYLCERSQDAKDKAAMRFVAYQVLLDVMKVIVEAPWGPDLNATFLFMGYGGDQGLSKGSNTRRLILYIYTRLGEETPLFSCTYEGCGHVSKALNLDTGKTELQNSCVRCKRRRMVTRENRKKAARKVDVGLPSLGHW